MVRADLQDLLLIHIGWFFYSAWIHDVFWLWFSLIIKAKVPDDSKSARSIDIRFTGESVICVCTFSTQEETQLVLTGLLLNFFVLCDNPPYKFTEVLSSEILSETLQDFTDYDDWQKQILAADFRAIGLRKLGCNNLDEFNANFSAAIRCFTFHPGRDIEIKNFWRHESQMMEAQL